MKLLHLMLILLVLFLFSCGREKTYRSGRDTVKSFGNGRFQVLRLQGDRQVLYDVVQQETVLKSPMKWKPKDGFVIFSGNKGGMPKVLRLNLKTSTINEEIPQQNGALDADKLRR